MQIEKELKYSIIVYFSLKLINLLFKFEFNISLLIAYFVGLFSIENMDQFLLPKVKSYMSRVIFEGVIKYATIKKIIGCQDILNVVLYQEAGDLFVQKIKF